MAGCKGAANQPERILAMLLLIDLAPAARRRYGRTGELKRIFARSDRLSEEGSSMSVQDAGFYRPVAFPSNALSDVPFRVYTGSEQYRLEQERIFKGPTWNYLCLAGEISFFFLMIRRPPRSTLFPY